MRTIGLAAGRFSIALGPAGLRFVSRRRPGAGSFLVSKASFFVRGASFNLFGTDVISFHIVRNRYYIFKAKKKKDNAYFKAPLPGVGLPQLTKTEFGQMLA
jgi:hypothetical protein